MTGEYTLVQLGSEFGGVYMNASPDLAALVATGTELARYYTGTEYGVLDGSGSVIWSSGEKRRYVLARLLGAIEQMLSPGFDLEKLLRIGATIAQTHPDWRLVIYDPDRRTIWQTGDKGLNPREGGDENERNRFNA